MEVHVCIPSIGRGTLLETVSSVLNQQLPPDFRVKVIVVDDSKSGLISTVLSPLLSDPRLHIVISARSNISAARNVGMNETCKANYVAFIDDDEIADEQWLISLVSTAEREAADVVFGPVQPIYLPGCPDWAEASGLFRKDPARQSTPVRTGATCNALLRNTPLVRSIKFDERFGRTGGEDTVYFSCLFKLGCKLLATDVGIVREYITPERLDLEHIKRRYVRGGQTSALVLGSQSKLSPFFKVIGFFRSLFKFIFLSLLSTLALDVSVRIRRQARAWAALGEIHHHLNIRMKNVY